MTFNIIYIIRICGYLYGWAVLQVFKGFQGYFGALRQFQATPDCQPGPATGYRMHRCCSEPIPISLASGSYHDVFDSDPDSRRRITRSCQPNRSRVACRFAMNCCLVSPATNPARSSPTRMVLLSATLSTAPRAPGRCVYDLQGTAGPADCPDDLHRREA